MIVSKVLREISPGPKCTSQIWVCCAWSTFFFRLLSSDVCGSGTRDEPLRNSAWEAKGRPPRRDLAQSVFLHSLKKGYPEKLHCTLLSPLLFSLKECKPSADSQMIKLLKPNCANLNLVCR